MHFLHRVYDDDGEIRFQIERLRERIQNNPVKTGVILDLNPFWLHRYYSDLAGIHHQWWGFDYRHTPILDVLPIDHIPDLNWRDELAERMIQELLGREFPKHFTPYLLKIVSRPDETVRSETGGFRQELRDAARDCDIPTIIETRPPPRFVTSPGDSVVDSSGSSPGTIGGFLEDAISGDQYAVTCGHVISSGSAISNGSTIGNCPHAKDPVPLPSGTHCGIGCGFINNLDVALIDLSGTTVTNKATGIRGVVGTRTRLEMHGATSGHKTYEVGGAVIEHEIGGTCWERLTQFHAPVSSSILPTSFAVAGTSPPKGGDSGAWLLDSSDEWAGMVVASDHLHGYAIAADDMIANSNSEFGVDLSLV